MANRSQSHYLDIGVLGEDLVTQWLRFTCWSILERRWSCHWGEIDIIARYDPVQSLHPPLLQSSELPSEALRERREPLGLCATPFLSFIEVKTRSHGNWDAGGLLSITPRKQAKLWQTARYFLAAHPHLAAYPCRFDVALVCYKRASQVRQLPEKPATVEKPIHLGQPVEIAGYQMLLQDYIPSAFEGIG